METDPWSLLRRLHYESVETGQLGSYGRAYGGSKLWLEVRDALDWHDKQQDNHPDDWRDAQAAIDAEVKTHDDRIAAIDKREDEDWRDSRVITSASGQGC